MATRAQAVALAESFIGCRTGDKRHHKIVNTFNSVKPHGEVGNYHCPWCAMTWTALMILLKMDQSKAAYSYNCGTLIAYSKKIGTWVENDAYVPLPGDGIIYYWGDSGRGDCKSGASHVGMIISINEKKKTFKVLEGNKGESSTVGVRTMSFNGQYIRGFIHPKYEGDDKKDTPKKRTNKELAQEIIAGKGNWGNGDTRKKRLTEAGYDYYAVQKEVNKLLEER